MARSSLGTSVLLALGLPSFLCVFAQAKPIEATGTLVPSSCLWVYPPIEGVVRAWHCKSGESVRKGQKIVTVASAEVQLRLDQLKAEIRISQDKMASLVKALEGALGPEKQRLVIDRTTEQAVAEAKSRELAHWNGLYNEGAIISPLDGTLFISDPEPKTLVGKMVTKAEPIFKVARLSEGWRANVWFAERDVGRLLRFLQVQEGKQAAVELLVAAFPDQTFKGTLHLEDMATEMAVHESKTVLYGRVRIQEKHWKDLQILPIGATIRVKVAVPERP